MRKKLSNVLAKDLWQAELGRGYGPGDSGYHLGQFIVIRKFKMPTYHQSAGQVFENYRWTSVQQVKEFRKLFPWDLVFSVHVSVMQDTKVPYFTYKPSKDINIDYMKDVHDFCISMRFNPVFVRDTVLMGDTYQFIAVDREEDALMVANYCISLGL